MAYRISGFPRITLNATIGSAVISIKEIILAHLEANKTALFGEFATGTYTFLANPSDNDTIVFNGVTYTFKDTPVGATDVQRGTGAVGSDTDLGLSITALLTVLNASADGLISVATYTDNSTGGNDNGTVVTVTYDTAVSEGNEYTLDTSTANITPSDATLTGGVDEDDAKTEFLRHIGSWTAVEGFVEHGDSAVPDPIYLLTDFKEKNGTANYPTTAAMVANGVPLKTNGSRHYFNNIDTDRVLAYCVTGANKVSIDLSFEV